MKIFKDRRFRLARLFSNRELRKFSTGLEGHVVNVSAGDDLDKENSRYADYFPKAASYRKTNWSGKKYRGHNGDTDEISLDLEADLPAELQGQFDVVFNHTTLEHIRHAEKAFSNLCAMSRDLVIIVVPFAQLEHETPGYNDYWRFTPRLMRTLFEENHFTVLYESANRNYNASTYLFFVAARDPGKWRSVFPSHSPVPTAAFLLGESFPKFLVRKLLRR